MLSVVPSALLSRRARGSARLLLVALACVFASVSGAPARAAVPGTFSYQGVLTDGAGAHVADGDYSVAFTTTQPSVGAVTSTLTSFTSWIGFPKFALPITEYGPAQCAVAIPGVGVRVAIAYGTEDRAVRGDSSSEAPTEIPRQYGWSNARVIGVTDPNIAEKSPDATGTAGWVSVQSAAPPEATSQRLNVTEQSPSATCAPAPSVSAESAHYQWIGFQFAPNNGYWDWSFAVVRAFPVTAGTHQYSFCTGRYGAYSPTGTSISNLNMVATFFPTTVGTVAGVPAGINESAELTPRVIPVATGPRATPPMLTDSPR